MYNIRHENVTHTLKYHFIGIYLTDIINNHVLNKNINPK